MILNWKDDKQGRFQICEDLFDLPSQSIPEKTKQKAKWDFRLNDRWAQWRKVVHKTRSERSTVRDILMVHSKLDVMAGVDLMEVLSQFIAEVRKEDGGQYPR